ncbi:integrase-like protein [Tamaricihabitans halophyticus]|uniref:Integrase-like protein n=1 Tax=Tamaricihabitans halophyticus TaxID=1262583 RepID=A0A4R2PYT9_9PSEU|nr:integrase-like protein [Tamaricihabitans halophyticus]
MALWQRDRSQQVQSGLICHSDAGSQYTSIHFTEHLDLEGLQPSIGSVGDAYETALAESVIAMYKTECIRTTVFHGDPFRTVADVELATAGWVDWYNNRRVHSSLGYIPPVEHATAHNTALNRDRNPHESGKEPEALQVA